MESDGTEGGDSSDYDPPGGCGGRVHGRGVVRRRAATVVPESAPTGGGGDEARGGAAGRPTGTP